jgi:outer membrane cobalamin receptor
VLRGPQSGLYGSNALAGVVNLITRRDVRGEFVSASIEAGELNTLQIQGSGGFGNGEDSASAGFHILTTDGYDTSPDRSAQGVPSVGGAKPGDKEGNRIANVYLRGGRAFGEVLRIDGIARYLNKDSELDGQSFSPPIAGLSYDDGSSTDHTQLLSADLRRSRCSTANGTRLPRLPMSTKNGATKALAFPRARAAPIRHAPSSRCNRPSNSERLVSSAT